MDFFWWCFAKEMDLISHSGFINGKINEYFHIYLKMLETAHTFHHTEMENMKHILMVEDVLWYFEYT